MADIVRNTLPGRKKGRRRKEGQGSKVGEGIKEGKEGKEGRVKSKVRRTDGRTDGRDFFRKDLASVAI